jgi:hypothetical protein
MRSDGPSSLPVNGSGGRGEIDVEEVVLGCNVVEVVEPWRCGVVDDVEPWLCSVVVVVGFVVDVDPCCEIVVEVSSLTVVEVVARAVVVVVAASVVVGCPMVVVVGPQSVNSLWASAAPCGLPSKDHAEFALTECEPAPTLITTVSVALGP